MKRFTIILSMFLFLGAPFLMAASQEATAQTAGLHNQATGDPETHNAVNIENVRRKANLQDAENGFNQQAADRKNAKNDAKKAKKEAKAFEFNHMVGNSQFGAEVNGVPGADAPMTVKGGNASLDKSMNFDMEVKGLRFEDGQSAAGKKFHAGVACMDSGAFMAMNEDADNPDNSGQGSFEVDEKGDAHFNGKMNFAGASCVAPTPMVTDENGKFVAVGGHGMMSEEAMMEDNSDDDKGKNDDKDEDHHDDEDDDNHDDDQEDDEDEDLEDDEDEDEDD